MQTSTIVVIESTLLIFADNKIHVPTLFLKESAPPLSQELDVPNESTVGRPHRYVSLFRTPSAPGDFNESLVYPS